MTRLYADTNIFLRFLLKDNDEQAKVVREKFVLARKGKIEIIILSEIIPELVYVLSGLYKLSREEVYQYIVNIIKTPYFKVVDRSFWIEAMSIYAKVNIDVVDIFLALKARDDESKVFSFDRDFEKLKKHL